jgi:ABC-type nickel/cobalt efflux system permease component RcnA
MVRIFRVLAMLFIAVSSVRFAADAHPLGNFTSNHLSRITIDAASIDVQYVLDDAEIPTFTLLRSLDAHGTPSRAQLLAWAARHANEIAAQLLLTSDGKPLALSVRSSAARLRPGAAGLSTLYFTASYRAVRAAGAQRIEYSDTTLPGRIGWKDVVVAPQNEPTRELQSYPDALIGSPRDRTSVALTISAAGTVAVSDTTAAPVFGIASTAKMNDLSDVLARNLADPLVLFGALLIAIGLGALHALEPGHGKTLLAISLVGARATVPQAFILAVSLTLAHTAGVLVFGVVVLTLARYIVPETLYPWIALLSGSFVAILGARALARELKRRSSVSAAPAAGDRAAAHAAAAARAFAQMPDHNHDDLDEEAHARAHMIPGTAPISFRSALVAATTGNVAPCPAALVVLLAAIATHRIGWGLILIVAFSAGLALTLTLLGVAVVRGAAWLTRRPQFDRFARFAPLVTAVAISAIGAWMVGEGVVAQGLMATPAVPAFIVLAAIVAFIALQTRHRAPTTRRVPA